MDLDVVAKAILDAVTQSGGKCTFGIDVSDWIDDDIRNLIDTIQTGISTRGFKLKGIRAGGDVMFKLGGVSDGVLNARMMGTLPVVSVPEFGKMEMVFQP